MKITITNRWTGVVLYESEQPDGTAIRTARGRAVLEALKAKINLSGSNLSGSNLSGSNLSGSNLRGSDLRGSNLSGSNLRGSDLSDSDLRGSDLRDSDLSGSNLRGSDLSDSDLRGSDLRGSDLSGSDRSLHAPIIPNLHGQIAAAIQAGGTLEMGQWHGCGTTHCYGGWAVQLAGEAGKVLESCIGTNAAAALILTASCPTLEGKVPDFFASNEDALAEIQRLAELEAVAAK